MLAGTPLYTAFPAKDVQRLKSFFAEKLGLTPTKEDKGIVSYESGGSKFFIYQSQYAGTNQATAACFDVPDAEAVVKELEGKGVVFEQYDGIPGVTRQGSIHTSDDGMKAAWFKDTEGNIISVTQYAPAV